MFEQELKAVRESRGKTNKVFPLPDFRKCFRYMGQEVFEYDDADIRLLSPEHKRNHDKKYDRRKEFGQAIYMFFSAVMQTGIEGVEPYGERGDVVLDFAFSALVVHVGLLLQDAYSQPDPLVLYKNRLNLFADTWACCLAICNAYGWDVCELVQETCRDFERKHLGTVDMQPDAELLMAFI